MNRSAEIEQVSASLFGAHAALENPGKDARGQVPGKKDYRYLSLPALIDHLRPALEENELFVTQELKGGGGFVEVVTTVWHASGQYLEFGPTFIAYGGDAQQAGSAATYCRRYALAAVFNLAPDEDDDARSTGGRGLTQRPSHEPSASRSEPATGEGGSEQAVAPEAYGEGADGAAATTVVEIPLEDADAPATTEQWERLLAIAGTMTKAVSKINAANKTGYKEGSVRGKATRAEVSAAITGGK